ncbi:hypothetical protein B0I37DRAFT_350088 [Chaetomium sp. MPI-CAGE-AT-0009]|nr:hypothetical protein B0I37DRAFT_350088 [Chaetomium sp. MPI-CAGE-AT-0009]
MNTITFAVPLTRSDSTDREDSMTPPRLPNPTPMPPRLTIDYAPVFDSDDENDSGYSDSFDSSSDIGFNKRSITPTPPSLRTSSPEGKKPSSLIALSVEKSRAVVSVTPTHSEDWASYSSDGETESDSDGGYLPIAQQVAMEFRRENQPIPRSPAESLLTDILAELEQSAGRRRSAREQPPLSPAIRVVNSIRKTITTNLKCLLSHRRRNIPAFPPARRSGPASQTAPIAMPLTSAQRAFQRHNTEYVDLPLDMSLVGDRRALAAAGPLGRGERKGKDKGVGGGGGVEEERGCKRVNKKYEVGYRALVGITVGSYLHAI